MGAAYTERILLETLDKISELKSVRGSSKKNQHLWCEEPTEKFSQNANEKDQKKKKTTKHWRLWKLYGKLDFLWKRSESMGKK